MKKLLDQPLFLLLSTGLALGFYFPIGKQASGAGFNPLAWAMMISLVPGAVMLAISMATDRKDWPSALIPFGLVSGLTAYVIPNGLVFAAIPHVGSGYVALMFALSPVFTALLSLVFRVRPPDRALMTGVAFGFCGAALITFSRFQLGWQTNVWPLLALAIPLSLAVGNVYRTARWPRGVSTLRVGAVANLGTLPLYLVLFAWFQPEGVLPPFAAHPVLALVQITVSLAMFLVFFRLQWVGGPTYLSQIGYVAAAVGLGLGACVLGETYPWQVWIGAMLIGLGVLISLRMKKL